MDANLIRGRFEIKGIEAAAERLGRNWSLNELVIGGGAFLVAANDFERYSKIHSVIRRRTSSSGCLNLLTLAADLEVNDIKIDKLRSLVDAMPEVAWLDSERTWFFATDSARNRLFNLVSKVLGVCTRIRVGELRRAVSRSRRLAVAPPQNILGHFVEAAKLGHLEGTFVVANPENVSPPEVGTAEATLLQVLDQFGPVLAGEEFAERCVSAGMNATTFYIYRLISPLVSSLGRGVYCKVGADIAPGTVEEIQSRRASMARASDHGWTQKGMLWFGLEVSLSVITAGSITLDSFVADLAQGEWTVDLPGGGAVDKVLCKGRFIWSFRRSLTLLGTEPGDVIILEFDTRARRIGLRVGGMELLEAAQEGSDLSIEAEDPGS